MEDKQSIRQKQNEVVTAMINLNSDWQPEWKSLIYDTVGENIIAPLISINELKNNYVVQQSSLDSTLKEPIPDVSAIYFVMPTDENIERICQDLKDHLYDSYYLNFISPIPKPKLKIIADVALSSDNAPNVRKVYDQYLNFIALEDDLFILRNKMPYYAINRGDEDLLDCIVDGLFSFLVTMKSIPVIRCPRGGSAEIIANKLSKLITEHLDDNKKRKLLMGGGRTANERPVLCLIDRSVDMSSLLHHTWTYQALVHDLLNWQLNRVQIVEDDGDSTPKAQFFDLSPDDKFWSDHKGCPFPQVAEAVQQELDDYKKLEDKVKIGFNDDADEGYLELEPNNRAMSILELRENKRIIEKHTVIATAILNEIKARKLDNFFELEEKIMNRSPIDKVTLDDILATPGYGHPRDKYRLFLISYICDNPNLSDSEAGKYMDLLETFGCNRAAFDYVRSWKTFSRTNVDNLQSKLESSGGVLKTANMFSKLMSKGSKFVMEGVKNLVLKEHHLPITKIIDNLMDSRSRPSRESLEYSYIDPMSSATDDIRHRKKLFQSAIVFVVGGGNYIEYQNLVDYSKTKTSGATGFWGTRKVVYGSTNLVNGFQFLDELECTGH